MKKNVLMFMLVAVLMFTLIGVSYSWQGRMEGMGSPEGLVSDESDLLIHPARIVDGKGGRLYSHYGFSYTGSRNDWEADSSGSLLPINLSYDLDNDGYIWWNEALMGGSFSLGSGTIGLFLEYAGKYGNFEGEEVLDIGGSPVAINSENDVNTDLSDFAFRVVYGVPLGDVFKLGTEVKIAYREEKAVWDSDLDISGIPISVTGEASNLLTGLSRYMFPYDSDYWDLSFKLGLKWNVGGVECDLTPRGGFIFAGNNEWDSDVNIDIDVGGGNIYPTNEFDMDGDVDGWNFGLDFWLRFPVTEHTSMPLVFRIDYQEKERDGSGEGDLRVYTVPPGGPLDGLVAPIDWDYDNEETSLTITAGGGFDIGVSENTNLAIGLFYNYIHSKTDLAMTVTPVGSGIDIITETGGYPEYSEHQVKFQFAGEHRVSPCLKMRGGLGVFYGSIEEDYDFDGGVDIAGLISASSLLNNSISLDGNRWGIEASLGATWVCNQLTIEPFINGGYQRINLDGDEDWSALGIDLLSFDVDKEKNEWFIGGGFSVLFDL